MNALDLTLEQLFATKFREFKVDKHPAWVTSLVSQCEPRLIFCIKQKHDQYGNRFDYRHLEASSPLALVLKGTVFIEFPQIEVYTDKEAPRANQDGDLFDFESQDRKRRKLNPPPKPQGLVTYDTDSQSSGPESDTEPAGPRSAIVDYSDDSAGVGSDGEQ